MSHDNKFQQLVEIAEPMKEKTIVKAEQKAAKWAESPFGWLVLHPVASATKGSIGKRLVKGLCHGCGMSATPYKGKRADILVEGHLVSVKFALLSEAGAYTFEQIRENGSEFLFCLGVSSMAAHVWIFSMKEGFEHFEPQHAPESRWIQIQPNEPPEWIFPKNPPGWMQQQSGNIDEVCKTFRKLLGK